MLWLVHVSPLTRQRGAFLDLLPPNFAIQHHKLAAASRRPANRDVLAQRLYGGQLSRERSGSAIQNLRSDPSCGLGRGSSGMDNGGADARRSCAPCCGRHADPERSSSSTSLEREKPVEPAQWCSPTSSPPPPAASQRTVRHNVRGVKFGCRYPSLRGQNCTPKHSFDAVGCGFGY